AINKYIEPKRRMKIPSIQNWAGWVGCTCWAGSCKRQPGAFAAAQTSYSKSTSQKRWFQILINPQTIFEERPLRVKADMTLATPALSPWAAALTTHVGTRKSFTNQNRADVSFPRPQDCT